MNRRTFLKSIAMIGVAASIPSALMPQWKHGERDLVRFCNVPIIVSDYAPANTIYFLSVDGVYQLGSSQLARIDLMT